MSVRTIELLSPAKNVETAKAAVDHGADAIYMGGAGFGARSAARNTLDEVARAVEYAHQYGVRLYSTLNTLIYDDEIDSARELAQGLLDVGVDALIIQDMAYLRMGLHSDYGVEFHASTQMCNMNSEGVGLLRDIGFKRVVLERNLSLTQIEAIARDVADVELEAFIHGAICVGYSGRCYLSRSLSARSGNRGECSQPCRLSYDLVDDAGRRLIEKRHLLSVKDLNLSTMVGELLDRGVSSFKIEGRLKDVNYIKNVVAHYRQLLDEQIAQRGDLVRASAGRTRVEFQPNPTKSFTRGESTYLLCGKTNSVASFDSPKAMGERIGSVNEVQGARGVVIESDATLTNGDGLCFVTPKGVVGASVNGVEPLRKGRQVVMLNAELELRGGEDLYRNLDKRFEMAVASSRTERRVGVRAELRSTNRGFEVSYLDEQGFEASAKIEMELEPTKRLEYMQQIIEDQLCKCGDTIFECSGVDRSKWGGEFIPASIVAKTRREALEKLRATRLAAATKRQRSNFTESLEPRISELTADVGVTNHLAEEFYRDHGVESIPHCIERYSDFEGVKVLESSYCLRSEIGECLLQGSTLKEPLFIERGAERYRLRFDCKRCQMALIKESI